MTKQFRKFFQEIIVDVFAVCLITFIIFFLAEDWLPGLVANYVRLEFLLLFCLLAGLLAAIFGKPRKIKTARWVWTLGGGGMAVLFILPRVADLGGWLGYLIAVLGGLAVGLVVFLAGRKQQTINKRT